MVGRRLALSLLVSLASLAAGAQDLLPEVVVEAPRAAQLEGFVDQALGRTHDKQLARWHRPICATLRGFTADQEASFTARLHAVTAIVGLDQPKAGCKPNAIVLLTDDPDRLIEAMLTDYPRIFAPAKVSDARAELAKGGVVRFWSAAVTNSAQGSGADIMAVSAAGAATQVRVPPGNATRLASAARADMFRSMLVLDVRGLRGLPLMAVADHAAMRLLGQIGETGVEGPPSILSLFQPGDGPRPFALTDWDRALLRELYAAPVSAGADRQRRQIARRLTETAAAQP